MERSLTLAIRFNESKVVGNIDGQEVINLRLTTEMPFRFALFLLGYRCGERIQESVSRPGPRSPPMHAGRDLDELHEPRTSAPDLPMTPQFSELVHPVISYALDLKERLDNGEEPDLEAEQRQLIERLRSDSEVRRLTDYMGDGSELPRRPLRPDLLDRRAVHRLLALGRRWKERILEVDPLRDPGPGVEVLGAGRDRPAPPQDAHGVRSPRARRPGDVLPLRRPWASGARYLENPGQGEGVHGRDASPGDPVGELGGAARARSQDQRRAAPGPCDPGPGGRDLRRPVAGARSWSC